jgi:NAD(P)-dependent dehydrogenase (short-subunit alcohol dehydrogenase family)
MTRVAPDIAEAEPRIDVLINNAGAMFATRKLTEDGLEFTFALNHMAYFVVTQGLRERLVASAPAWTKGGAKSCGYAASLGQRKRVAHLPTAEAARSGLIFEGQGQARLHLKSKPPWSHKWGPVQVNH